MDSQDQKTAQATRALHQVLRSENLALVDHLTTIRAEVGEPASHLSILRTFDIVFWMADRDEGTSDPS